MYPRAVMIGVGASLPRKVVTNDELSQTLDTSDEWIQGRTGIRQRHIASDGETTASLATQAARQAMDDANISADSLDMILVATSTPDTTMPSTACLVQSALGNHRAAAMDLNAACSGFVFGLHMANAQIRSGAAKRVLVIGAETMSRIVDWSDRGTCVLFGDGAGAIILQAQEKTDRGILDCRIFSDGAEHTILGTNGGISQTQTAGHLQMNGKEVFRHAVDKMSCAFQEIMSDLNLAEGAIRWVIPHQANTRIIQSIAKKLGLSQDRFIITLDQHANTSAASIPLALADAKEKNLLRNNDILALPALGAGLTWGCCIIKL